MASYPQLGSSSLTRNSAGGHLAGYSTGTQSSPHPTEQSLGLQILKLVVESNRKAPKQARHLILQAQHEVGDLLVRREIMELIQTIVVYKFPKVSRKELEQMLGLGDLKETKFYQEAKQETKLEAIPRLLKIGLTVQQVAQALDLSVDEVKKAAQQK